MARTSLACPWCCKSASLYLTIGTGVFYIKIVHATLHNSHFVSILSLVNTRILEFARVLSRNNMNWLVLFIAGIFEVIWAIGLKYSHGFSRLLPSAVTAFAMIMSFVLLGIAARSLPIGTAYAVWTGIGTVGTVIAGIYLFHETLDWGRVCCMLFILAGVAGLRILSR